MLPSQPSAPLSVSQLNRQVKQLLETQYPAIPVQGEISTLSRPASGHIYFTLKDQQAQIRCAMFKSALARSKYSPKQGDEVVAIGRLSLYEGRGDYQLIVNHLQPVGEGALQAEFFRLKDRLEQEGLFAGEQKQPLPKRIRRVGVVTSATGAAFHDIVTVLQRRYPALEIILYPTAVQGNEATATIVAAIATANARNEVDVLIVGRGGGSLEDLWCFNTEALARSIFASRIPVVSAVGHEVDIAITDFVADVRAATPSQAAELVSPDQFEQIQLLDSHEQRLVRAITSLTRQHSLQLNQLKARLKSPADLVGQWREQLQTMQPRLHRAIQQPIARQTAVLDQVSKRLHQASPARQLTNQQQRLQQLSKALEASAIQRLEAHRQDLQQAVAKLNVLSPLATLERGYSITRSANGMVLQSANDVVSDQQIETILQEGRVLSTVTEILPNKNALLDKD